MIYIFGKGVGGWADDHNILFWLHSEKSVSRYWNTSNVLPSLEWREDNMFNYFSPKLF